MATIEEVLDQVDGLRRDAAGRVQERFGSVAELANASTEQLTAVTGIGRVMADRIQAAARTARRSASEVPRQAQGTAARAASTAERAIDRTADSARRTVDDLEARAHTNVHRLHARSDRAVEDAADRGRAAESGARHVVTESRSLVDRAIGLVTAPARRLLDLMSDRRR